MSQITIFKTSHCRSDYTEVYLQGHVLAERQSGSHAEKKQTRRSGSRTRGKKENNGKQIWKTVVTVLQLRQPAWADNTPGTRVHNLPSHDDPRSADYYHINQKTHKYKSPGQPVWLCPHTFPGQHSLHLGTCGPATVGQGVARGSFTSQSEGGVDGGGLRQEFHRDPPLHCPGLFISLWN